MCVHLILDIYPLLTLRRLLWECVHPKKLQGGSIPRCGLMLKSSSKAVLFKSCTWESDAYFSWYS